MPYFVYIIECSNKALYTGITNDLERRFEQHRTGQGGHYTAYNPALKLKYFEEHKTRSEAAKRESQIKSWPRTNKLALIKRKSSKVTGSRSQLLKIIGLNL